MGKSARSRSHTVLIIGLGLTLALAARAESHFDPYQGAVLPTGPFKGELIDPTKRSLKVLSEEEAAPFHPQPGERLVYNFYYNGEHYIAKFPAAKPGESVVKDVRFQVEVFPVILFGLKLPIPAGHSQLRMTLKEGQEITLYRQSDRMVKTPEAVGKIRDFIVSAEAASANGEEFNLAAGTQDHYALAHRFMALESKYDSMITAQNHTVDQYSLKISEDEKQRLLEHAIAVSDKAGMGEMYHTIMDSCATAALDLIDAVVRINHPRWLWHFFRHIPNKAPLDLWVRGIRHWRFWNKELGNERLNDEMIRLRRARQEENKQRVCVSALELLS